MLSEGENSVKRWKFDKGDLEKRELSKQYLCTLDEVIQATSTDHAP